MLGAVLLLGAVVLASMPFREGGVRCGPPLFGADASLSDPPSDEFGPAIIPYGCADEAVGRLVLASALVVPGILLTAIGLWLNWRRESSSSGTADWSRAPVGS